MRIALVGFMGAGKTTTGRRLAARSGLPFVDLDALVEAREGSSIPALFAVSEARFREAERLALADVIADGDCVLATGGGTPCQAGAMDALMAWGHVVYLEAPLAVLAERVGEGKGRPVWSEAAERLTLREPVYRLAHQRVDATRPPEQVVAAILAAL
ncbi:MAG TPA: shikimate kinase [Myxococcota bacterium]|nr:shikimate kinase [Myxococcota bacterium]